MLEEKEDITINSFQNYGFCYQYFEEKDGEREYVFEYPSKEDKNWQYTVTYYWPSNDLNVIKEHKYSKDPVWYSVLDCTLSTIDDLKYIKRLVLC